MINRSFHHGVLVGFLFMASVVSAQEYPAADFQPKVLYQDASIVESAAETKSTVQVPCVNQAVEANKSDVVAEVDAKYPASSFQPKVIFSETN